MADGVPTVAILHSMDLIEEWLDHLHLSLDDLKHELMGSWKFSYAEALARAGVATVFVFITQGVRNHERVIHTPTRAVIWLLRPPRSYSLLRTALESEWVRDRWAAGAVMRHLAPYLATPLLPLARVLRAERCGAIICQEYECPRFDVAVFLGRTMGVPVFPSFHAGDFRSRLERVLHPITVRACAGVIISADVEARRAQEVYRIPGAKLARIPNPIDLEVWQAQDRAEARAALGIPPDAVVAIWHGAVYLRAKGLDLLVDAWDRVTRERPERDLRLVLVGAGADSRELERLVAGRRLRGVQLPERWLHDRRRLRLYLSASDLYVFPSRYEGFPNALLEAMACGLPIVATDIAGVPDIVGRDSAAGGVLVRPEDSVAFAGAVGQLLDDRGRRGELARRARLRVDERFSLDVVGAQLRDFLIARGMRTPDTRGASAP